ncbi:MAG TPA: EbsA family protein [Candidatus Atopostipes pullistercoris]|uniref:EbsA family protein n=1 Tax=Candidatus Atopostipes pullistercoris TaxID=2838467 RepID=A0A9D2JZ47_9LACT|nr:EbsA family protein [Candidatus Atopostipes pullistercoris]
MNNKNIKPLKLNIRFELAYEVISYSILVILIGLAYVFASNLLAFNWYTVIFGVLAIFLYILKRKSYLLIEKDVLSIYYFYFFKKKKIEMKTIDEFVFYKSSRKVEIRSNNQTILIIYLKDKKKRKLLDWLVQHYPNIPCLFFSENETIG